MSTTAPREVGAPGGLGGFGVAAGREELLQEESRARDPQPGPGPFPSPPSLVGPQWGLLGVPWGASPVVGCEGGCGDAGGRLGLPQAVPGVIWGVGADPNLTQIS